MTLDDTDREDGTVTIGGFVDRVTVSLRVIADDLDPEEVSRLLNCQPTKSHVKGEVIVGRNTGLRQVAPTGVWLLNSNDERSVGLGEQVMNLLGRVSDDPAVWETLTKKYKAEVFCGLFLDAENRECWLSADALRHLAERGVDIGFDIYAVFDDAE
jgi:hypothetical protein